MSNHSSKPSWTARRPACKTARATSISPWIPISESVDGLIHCLGSLRVLRFRLFGLDRVVGFEALARWHDPELGSVSPADFVPVAEQTGLIAPLGRWVLEELCRQLAGAEAALARTGARVAFNVSTREFGPHLVRDIAETHNVSPSTVRRVLTGYGKGNADLHRRLKASGRMPEYRVWLNLTGDGSKETYTTGGK